MLRQSVGNKFVKIFENFKLKYSSISRMIVKIDNVHMNSRQIGQLKKPSNIKIELQFLFCTKWAIQCYKYK